MVLCFWWIKQQTLMRATLRTRNRSSLSWRWTRLRDYLMGARYTGGRDSFARVLTLATHIMSAKSSLEERSKIRPGRTCGTANIQFWPYGWPGRLSTVVMLGQVSWTICEYMQIVRLVECLHESQIAVWQYAGRTHSALAEVQRGGHLLCWLFCSPCPSASPTPVRDLFQVSILDSPLPYGTCT